MFIICSSLLIKYSTFTVFVSAVKAFIILVSSSIINISYAGFRKIIDIIIINNNVSSPKIDPWGTPLFIGKVYHRFALNNRVHVCHTSISVVCKHSGGTVPYSIGNMNNKD